MRQWDSGTVGQWDSGTVGQWDSGTVGQWDSGFSKYVTVYMYCCAATVVV